MNFFLITGVSSGIGEALSLRILRTCKANATLIAFGRKDDNRKLHDVARECKSKFVFYEADLTKAAPALAAFERALGTELGSTAAKKACSVILVHNAGVLPLARVGDEDPNMIERAMMVNVTTPMILSNAFVRHVKSWSCANKMIVAVSSGAAERPFAGWHAYCASKAGLEMSLKVLATEQADEKHPVLVRLIRPGIVATHMQAQIAAAPKEACPAKEFLAELKSKGLMYTPDDAAVNIASMFRVAELGDAGSAAATPGSAASSAAKRAKSESTKESGEGATELLVTRDFFKAE